MQHNSRPKLVATGIAPLGIVAIGVVPMGVISLGAVGMGLISAAAVNMGVVTAGITTMGVAWSGIVGMGPYQLGTPQPLLAQSKTPDSAKPFIFDSRKQAEARATEMGCSGAHQHGPGGKQWMPCSTMADFMRVSGSKQKGHHHH